MSAPLRLGTRRSSLAALVKTAKTVDRWLA